MRHRVSIQDLGVIAAIMLVLAYIAFEIDIFAHEGRASFEDERITLNEMLLLGTVLSVGLLIFAIRRYRDQKREIELRIAAERLARELAYQDPLTGLANRRQFDEALGIAVASPPAAGSCHAVLLLDLNGFKKINDNYGHSIGDEVLVVVAQRLSRAARDDDLVARLGGDEFVVLARHLIGPEAVANIALRVIQGFDDAIATGGVVHHVGTAIGIALLPADGASGEEILRKADLALYRAKAERRSSFRFFEEEMDRYARERGRMERDLRKAVGNDLIRPLFRPSVDLISGRVLGFEVVPGWRTAGGEEVPPERFIPIAEETGLVHAMARRVLELACAAARRWPQDVTLSIDVLASQLRDRDFATSILRILREAGFAPSRLEIDVAESLIVQNLDAAKLALRPLRNAGVRIALANFGTGYSNLYHIQEFGFDKVKIDRRFVEKMEEEDAARIVRALAGLGHGLGLPVSADGIPTATGNSLLLASGIREGQPSSRLASADETFGFFDPTSARSDMRTITG
ncbi:EAL domain-containing protein [Mesorhizobium sp. LHD-90]|uniref:putative bifunctional diguanylate cyclase/phosphodiesterase n=1 Tax=Mesorhizobium sp. LHD-90 TaxID=3071414 RepID=UPI0027DFC420|nr:EAL domain-containing protein [Mesorhizobium sp. LHD-90]MDQ6433073.1 EAL domain-containing protein [Mesorhizobium sp. LHD-90]